MGETRSKLLRKRRLPLIQFEATEFVEILQENGVSDVRLGDPERGTLESVTLYYTASNRQQDQSLDNLEKFREKMHAEALEQN